MKSMQNYIYINILSRYIEEMSHMREMKIYVPIKSLKMYVPIMSLCQIRCPLNFINNVI